MRFRKDPYLWIFYLACVGVAAYLVAARAISVSEVGAFLAAAAILPPLVERRSRSSVDDGQNSVIDVENKDLREPPPPDRARSAPSSEEDRTTTPPSS